MRPAFCRKGVLLSALELAVDGAVATLTLNRPEKRNAITDEIRDDLAKHLAALDGDPAIRVVIFTGVGDAFCAGVDLGSGGGPTGPAGNPIVGRPRLTDPFDRFMK